MEPNPARTGNIESLKIGTESRGNHSLCSGLELHHPIMSKLWNLGGRTKRKKERKGCLNIRALMSFKKSCRILRSSTNDNGGVLKNTTAQFHKGIRRNWY